jgi:hypothetical protein
MSGFDPLTPTLSPKGRGLQRVSLPEGERVLKKV